jgi:hypothetical protein
MPTATQALQTREAALVSAWVVFQRNVARLSIAAICALAAQEPKRRDDGAYDPSGGLGRPLAKSTTYRYLAEARESFREEYLKRPVLDMVMEEDERLEHLAAETAQVIRMSEPGSPRWQAAYDRHLRTLESRRKLLGLDQPVRVEVTAEVTTHDDPASAKLAEAMADAKARRDELMAEVTGGDA